MDLNKPVSYIDRAFSINRSIEETNKATQTKLLHLLLIVIGAVFGWLLCYFFPLKTHRSELIGTRHTIIYPAKQVIRREDRFRITLTTSDYPAYKTDIACLFVLSKSVLKRH